jgi:plasmid maintenance system antidote protein VapI
MVSVEQIIMSKKQRGKALRTYMVKRGMRRQRELAREIHLSDVTISLYLHGKRSFSVKTALRVSAQTGIPIMELFQ